LKKRFRLDVRKLAFSNGVVNDWNSFRVHTDYTISIADSSTLRYRGARRSNDIIQKCTSHVCIARGYRPNAHTGNNNLRDGHLKGPDILPVSNRVPSYTLLFDLYFAHSTFKPTMTAAAGVGGSFLSGRRHNALPTPAAGRFLGH